MAKYIKAVDFSIPKPPKGLTPELAAFSMMVSLYAFCSEMQRDGVPAKEFEREALNMALSMLTLNQAIASSVRSQRIDKKHWDWIVAQISRIEDARDAAVQAARKIEDEP